MSTPAAYSQSDFDYESLRKKYHNQLYPCPTDFSFPSHVLDVWAKKDPQLLAIHWCSTDNDPSKERKVTYKELSDLSHRCAVGWTQSYGIKKGDRVMVQLPRVVEWWVSMMALLRIGAVPIPGTSLLVGKDLQFRAKAAGAVAFIGDSEACSRFETVASSVNISRIFQVRVENDGGLGSGRVDLQKDVIGRIKKGSEYNAKHKSTDLAILYSLWLKSDKVLTIATVTPRTFISTLDFTSGTTGDPKMVLLENEYTLGHTVTGWWYRLSPGKLFCNMADLGWAKAAYSTFSAFNLGATLFIQPPPPGAFDPLGVLDMLHRYPIDILCCPPTMYRSLVTSSSLNYLKKNPSQNLQHCVSAGEPLNASVIVEWEKATGITICDGWGQTETVILVGNFQGVHVQGGSMGKVAPGFEVNVIGPKGEELPVGEEGELAVRTDRGAGSQLIFKGYLRGGKVDKREKTLNGKTWYCTGDRGIKDRNGYYWFVGRDDDVITSSGYRIGPFEVESALKEHPAVLESAAVASPDAQRGEIVKAFVILAAGYENHAVDEEMSKKLVKEIQDFFKTRTGPYKVPREIEFVETLPKTVSGKIRRIELRNLEYERKADIAKQLRGALRNSKL